MIKVIYFDFFGVVRSDGFWEINDIELEETNLWRDIRDSTNLGEMHWQEFVKEFALRSGKTETEIREAYKNSNLNRSLLALVNKLKEKYSVGLLTNASSEYLVSVLQETGLDDVFDPVVISSEVGFIKPQPEIYKYAEKQSGFDASESLFVDDAIRNVDAAKAAGWEAVQYLNMSILIADFHELGIL